MLIKNISMNIICTFKKLGLTIFVFNYMIACNVSSNHGKNSIDISSKNDTIAVYQWDGPCCKNKGIYNPKKYTEEQLKSTYELVYGLGTLGMSVAFRPSEIKNLSIDSLNKNYSNVITHLKSLNIVQQDYWKEMKEQRIREIEEMYELDKISIQIYSDSSVLLNNRFSEHCLEYVNALTSKDTSVLMSEWKKFAEQHKKISGDPEWYMKDFYTRYYSADRILYAKIDLITFGWYNCANDFVFHVEQDGKAEKEYEKLFTSIDSDCAACD